MDHFNANRTQKRPNYWVVKPGEFSNRGQGISCTDRADHIRARVNEARKAGRGRTVIVQEYISNPLLYYGRKFDIRAFVLVSTNGGKLRAYWYQEGYVRTSSYQWRLEDIADSDVHLTNDAIQQKGPDYGRHEPANKLNYTELQRYLDTLPRGRGRQQLNFHAQVYPRMKEVAAAAVRAAYPFLRERATNCSNDNPSLTNDSDNGNSSCGNFEIFGLDFIVDQQLRPWLLEVNTNPCLVVNCPVLERVIPNMLEHALRIAVDTVFPPPGHYSATHKYHIPENATHYNKFELLFDQDRDGPELDKLYKDSRVLDSIDDYEEDKETFEDDGEEF